MRFYILIFFLGVSSAFAQNYLREGSKIKAKADSFFLSGNLADAQKEYEKELAVYQKNQDKHRIALAKSNVAVMYLFKNDFETAIKLCREGLAVLPSKSETDTTRFRIYKFMGLYFANKRAIDSSNHYYDLIEKLIEKNKSVALHSDIISFYNEIAVKNLELLKLKKAENYLKKAEASLYLDKSFDKSPIYANFGLCYLLQRKYQNAITAYDKALSLHTSNSLIHYYLLQKGYCLQRLNKIDNAAEIYTNAWKEYQSFIKRNKAQNDINFEMSYYKKIGFFEQKRNQFSRAKMAFFRAISLEQNNMVPSIILAESHRGLAEVYLAEKKTTLALEEYQKSLINTSFEFKDTKIYSNPSLKKIYTPREMFISLMGKADALRILYHENHNLKTLTESLNTYKLAIQLAENVRRSFDFDSEKHFFTENYFDVYFKAISVADELFSLTKKSEYKDIAFDILERSRSVSLNDAMWNDEISFNTVDKQILEKEKTLKRDITTLQIKIGNTKDSAQLTKYQIQLTDKELEINKLITSLEKSNPNYYQLKYLTKYPSIKQIQQSILKDNSKAILYYSFDNESLKITLITHSKSSIYKIDVGNEFRLIVQDFRKLLANSPQGKKYNGQALSAELYDVLIKPIEKEIADKKRLIIIRDAELNYLPFEVLAKKKDDYLLKKYTISYAYSTSLLFHTKVEQKQGSGLLGFAPFSNNSFQQSLFRDKNLGQLPKSGNEVGKIGGDIYLEDEATKKRFYEKYRDKNVIHFATHAITDDSDPLKSFIAFYPDSVDYKLFTNELYDLDLKNTSLVMLSACETGAGKLQKGEGVMSLSRAFTYAGAKAVITTLWNAHDEASAYISERFYKHLKDGLKTDEALQQAKIDFLNSDLALRYEHPYYWANFILIGPAETIDFGTNWGIWGIAIISLLFLIFMVTRFRSKSISPKKAETRIG